MSAPAPAPTVAVLLDLAHGCGCGCAGRSLRQEAARSVAGARTGAHLLVLSATGGPAGGDAAEATAGAWSGGGVARVLSDWRADAASAYRLKCSADELGALSLRVITSRRGRARLLGYERALFSPLYTWTYLLGCDREDDDDDDDGGGVREADDEVAAYLRRLPSVGGPVRVLTSALIPPECFGHGFSTRAGGVSRVPTLSSLNLVSSPKRRDSAAVVRENRRRLALHAGFYPRPLHVLKVEHGGRVWVCGQAEPERYDAAVTDRPGTVLAAPGADCLPLLFADPVAGAVGAAHAGWRGTLLGVATATVAAMTTELGCVPEDILVVSGPSVGPCCFTLEPERAARFRPECVRPVRAGGLGVDLRLANRLQLQEAGIAPHHIHDDEGVAPCTACRPRDFFSHARDGAHFGSQAGFVWIREERGGGSLLPG
ncbi:purine nucleoside phosphorylase LACC1 [Corythoichthys intestinalis]|uniref:purine nucleoside phosphorylase LACC1 n=1 Tax=Corythoichthys intestinalis TaxID=161448 RepID=UPI0025A4D5FC|nr:purine nucleoside phosphorylase LACC1 [Corythoichthys intestinalis]XP_061799802.1 purine nucleoside phosphorylase LACC1-like [Nerophis lumbriciformis]